jgi:hypothetical protein
MKYSYYVVLATGILLLAESASWGQSTGAYGGVVSGTIPTALSFREATETSRIGANSNPALRHFAGKNVRLSSRSTLRAQVPLPRPVQVTTKQKPFSQVRRTSTISPYLSLDTPQSKEGIPNYYAFVKPLLQQQATNRSQQKQFGQLEQQLRAASANGIIANNPSGGIPTTGHSTQFLNMGDYFPGR